LCRFCFPIDAAAADVGANRHIIGAVDVELGGACVTGVS